MPNHNYGPKIAAKLGEERRRELADQEERLRAVAENENKVGTNKRSEAQVLQDRADMVRLTLEGYSQPEIADWINRNRSYRLSESQVFVDLKAVREQWVEMYLSDFDSLKARELAKIDHLEQEAWAAFYRSIEAKETVTSTKVDDKSAAANGNAPATYSRVKVEGKKEKRDGDVKFFDTIKWCIEQRCKIYGFNAPVTQSLVVDWREEAKRNGIENPSEMFNELVSKFVAEGSMGRGDDAGSAESGAGDSETAGEEG